MDELIVKASEGLTPAVQEAIAERAGAAVRVVLVADVADPELVDLVRLEVSEALLMHGLNPDEISVRQP